MKSVKSTVSDKTDPIVRHTTSIRANLEQARPPVFLMFKPQATKGTPVWTFCLLTAL